MVYGNHVVTGRAKNPERVKNPRKIRIKHANVGVIKSKKLNSFVLNIIKYKNMIPHSKRIQVKPIEDISLMAIEVNTYKWSQQIADFNYDENRKVLNKISTTKIDETAIHNILYVASLIELLGSKYINSAIILHKNNFMIADNEFSETICKYIDWQIHTAASYTIVIRNAVKIIEYKYKFDDLKF